MAACRPHASDSDEYTSTRESLFYPPNLPLSATLEIANHPILEAVRNTLFSTLPKGHHLIAVRDLLEIVPKGGRMTPLPKAADGRVARVIVTLPVRYRGGALIIRDPNDPNAEEIYRGGGKSHTSAQGHTGVGVDHLEWTAFLSDCDYEVEEVTKGLRLTISYAVFVRSFGTGGAMPDPLITPSDRFLDLIAPILNICRGRKIAFYLTGDYGVNPAEVLADSLVPNVSPGRSRCPSGWSLTSGFYLSLVERGRLAASSRSQTLQAHPGAPLDCGRVHLASRWSGRMFGRPLSDHFITTGSEPLGWTLPIADYDAGQHASFAYDGSLLEQPTYAHSGSNFGRGQSQVEGGEQRRGAADRGRHPPDGHA